MFISLTLTVSCTILCSFVRFANLYLSFHHFDNVDGIDGVDGCVNGVLMVLMVSMVPTTILVARSGLSTALNDWHNPIHCRTN